MIFLDYHSGNTCSGPNEEYLVCGGPCQKECATLGQPCNIAYIRCPDGCYCIEGYARNRQGKCIPERAC